MNLLNTVDWEEFLLSDVFSDKESCASIILLSRLGTILWIGETHLVVTRWCEDILGLSLSSQLRWEDLTLDVRVGTDVTDGQSDALAHDLCVQVVAFNLFLNFARQQFNRIGIGPVLRLIRPSLHVALVTDQVVIVDDGGRVLLAQLELKVGIVRDATSWSRDWVACDVDHIDSLSHGQVPKVPLVVDHVERQVQFLQLLEVSV